MARVAAIAAIICDNLRRHAVDRDEVIAAALIHDLGNIVKFDFTEDRTKVYGDEAGKDLDHWRSVKAAVIEKYGSRDDHIVTNKMLAEIGVTERLKQIVELYFSPSTVKSDDMAMRILLYSDARAGPKGVMNIKDRLDYVLNKWKGTDRESYYAGFIGSFETLEEELASKMQIAPSQISDDSIRPYMEKFLEKGA